MSKDVHMRVAACLTEILQEKNLTWAGLARDSQEKNGPHSASIHRLRGGRDFRFSTLVSVAAALGYDVVVNFRERV